MAKTLGSVAVGSIVYLNESGTAVPFYVVKHNYEATLNGNGRTALLRKEVYDTRKWHSGSNSVYTTSAIDAWLNSTYKSTLDAYIQEQIGETTFEVFAGNGDMTVVNVSRAIFIPALGELSSGVSDIHGIGDTFPVASTVRKLSTSYWTRTASSTSPRVQLINTNGGTNAGTQSTTSGSRPMFTLPETINVDDGGNITEPAAQILHGAMINNVLCVTKKCYAMINGVLCAVPYGLANVDGVMTKIQFEEPEPPAPPVQTYTVTIRTTTPGYESATYAYFEINGTKYSGFPTVTLTVDKGTEWLVYFSTNLASRELYINGKRQSNYSGLVGSNMDVDIRGVYNPANGYLAYFIYITTS